MTVLLALRVVVVLVVAGDAGVTTLLLAVLTQSLSFFSCFALLTDAGVRRDSLVFVFTEEVTMLLTETLTLLLLGSDTEGEGTNELLLLLLPFLGLRDLPAVLSLLPGTSDTGVVDAVEGVAGGVEEGVEVLLLLAVLSPRASPSGQLLLALLSTASLGLEVASLSVSPALLPRLLGDADLGSLSAANDTGLSDRLFRFSVA